MFTGKVSKVYFMLINQENKSIKMQGVSNFKISKAQFQNSDCTLKKTSHIVCILQTKITLELCHSATKTELNSRNTQIANDSQLLPDASEELLTKLYLNLHDFAHFTFYEKPLGTTSYFMKICGTECLCNSFYNYILADR
jgi:hypothetical protein